MKKINYLFCLMITGLLITSCNNLNNNPPIVEEADNYSHAVGCPYGYKYIPVTLGLKEENGTIYII